MVLLVSGFGWMALESLNAKLQRADVGLTGPESSITDEAQTILLVGSDDRDRADQEGDPSSCTSERATAENGAGRRSDTMILMHLSKHRDQVTMISLPRDSFVKIPAWTDDSGKSHPASNNKLNAAFAYRRPEAHRSRRSRPTPGVTIDHYVEVNFQGFVSMVDALGGVEVCTKKRDPRREVRSRPAQGQEHPRWRPEPRLRPRAATSTRAPTSAGSSASKPSSARCSARPRPAAPCSTRPS